MSEETPLGQGLTEAEFEDAIGDALDLLPEELLNAMDNVVILAQEEPDASQLRPEDYDEDGLPALLGLYEGLALTERDAPFMVPDQIFIFQGPLQRMCTTREELVDEIAVTVIHEIAHHFGISDERLHELGWE